ncbi:hypothetical protein VTN00DRAFT_6822 [Thermoascus crustaceus]|uniref:uncharacterized protein n=1 Tax=Thermoascus crustaceus TaxID=5088 RepID=UPI003743B159
MENILHRHGLYLYHSLSTLCCALAPVDMEGDDQKTTAMQRMLSHPPVQRRIAEHGKNQPTPPPSRWFRTAMVYLFGGFGSILLVGCILVFIAWKPLGDPPATANLALACVLLAVFIIQATFNAWQDWSSSRVMASIATMLPDECIVIRDGNQVCISAVDLVPGDIIKIKQGNKLADVRFIEISNDAKFDRSTVFPLEFFASMLTRIQQANLSLSLAAWTLPTIAILKLIVLVSRALTVFLGLP